MMRSAQAMTRNPMLALPAMAKVRALPPEAQEAISALLSEISADARTRADKAWRTHKAPMATYWKALSVYARHTRLALRVASDARRNEQDHKILQ